jgi:hypothetical protein
MKCIRMLPSVLKVKFFKAGACVGSIWRKGWKPMSRGNIMGGKGSIAEIHYCNGRVERVRQ